MYFAKLSKCTFGVTEVQYLGHIISNLGVSTDKDKIKAIQDWPRPRTVTGLRGFLGLTGYYRRFVRNYAQLTSPMTDLLQTSRFLWNDAAENSFNTLKSEMVRLPTLALPNFNLMFDVTTDASGTGVGAVLSQNDRPIAFFSKKLSARMQSASTYMRELYAIVEAVKKWRQYLLGRKFRIYTDQRSIRHIMSQVIQSPEQQRWASKLIGYDFEVFYKPGKENKVADALSRQEESHHLAFTMPILPWLKELRDFYTHSQEGRAWVQQVANKEDLSPKYRFSDGLMYFENRLFIPQVAGLRQSILQEFHSSNSGGHSGITATLKRLMSSFYWPGARSDVTNFIRECEVCQQTKYGTHKPYGLLQALPIPNKVWEDISMDFITSLPPSHGKSAVWVIVDRLTKFAHFIPLPPHYTATTLANIFLEQVYRLHGMPKSILSDRDPIFLSKFWKELFQKIGTKLLHSSAYHPQTDGQTEVVNRCLESYLRCFAHDEPRQWSKYIYLAEFWYNTSFHSAVGMTPFQALYGREPPAIPDYTLTSTQHPTIDTTLEEHNRVLTVLKENLGKSRQRMTEQANKHRLDKEFQIGELVYLRLRVYRQSSVAKRDFQKLSRRYFGPFKVLEKIGKVAYKLELPLGSRIHPVFHVSLLRPCVGQTTPSMLPLPELAADLEDKVPVEGEGDDTGMPGEDEARPTRIRKIPARLLD